MPKVTGIHRGDETRNYIKNGNFDLWKNGVDRTLLLATSGDTQHELADGWQTAIFQGAPVERVSIAGTGHPLNSKYAMRVNTSSSAELTNGTRLYVLQQMRSEDVIPLRGKTITMSALVRFSDATFTAAGAQGFNEFRMFVNSHTGTADADPRLTLPNDGSFFGHLANTDISNGSLPTGWTKITTTFTVPTNVNNLQFGFMFVCGASVEAYTTNNDDHWYEVSQVQVEEGSTASDFIRNGNTIEDEQAKSSAYKPAKKNFIANGSFDLWKAGTSVTYSGATYEVPSNIILASNASAVGTFERIDDAPKYSNLKYSLRYNFTSTPGSHSLYTELDPETSRELAGRTVSFGLWVQSGNFNNASYELFYNNSYGDTSAKTSIETGNTDFTNNSVWNFVKFENIQLPEDVKNGMTLQISLNNPSTSGGTVISVTGLRMNLGPTVDTVYNYASGDFETEELLVGPIVTRENHIVNGCMSLNTRGVASGSAIDGSPALRIDRIKTQSRSNYAYDYAYLDNTAMTDEMKEAGLKNSLKCTGTAVAGSENHYMGIRYDVEDFEKFKEVPCVFSAWVKSNNTNPILQIEYTGSAPATALDYPGDEVWRRIELYLPNGISSSATYMICFAWLRNGTPDYVNGTYIEVAGMKLEFGTKASKFERRPIHIEHASNTEDNIIGPIKNYIHNGSFDYARRGSTFTSPVYGSRCIERWSILTAAASDTNVEVSHIADSPSIETKFCTEVKKITASSGAISEIQLRQTMEKYDVRELATGKVTLSFWFKSNKATRYQAQFFFNTGFSGNSGNMFFDDPGDETWRQYTVTADISGPTDLGTAETGRGMIVDIGAYGGSADFAVNDYFRIAQVMMVKGSSVPKKFIRAGGDTSGEFLILQRYFDQLLYHEGTGGVAASWLFRRFTINFNTPMRSAPTVDVTGIQVFNGSWVTPSTRALYGSSYKSLTISIEDGSPFTVIGNSAAGLGSTEAAVITVDADF